MSNLFSNNTTDSDFSVSYDIALEGSWIDTSPPFNKLCKTCGEEEVKENFDPYCSADCKYKPEII